MHKQYNKSGEYLLPFSSLRLPLPISCLRDRDTCAAKAKHSKRSKKNYTERDRKKEKEDSNAIIDDVSVANNINNSCE